ncbi:MAG: sodium:alanine symporter family protein [Gammaproteobacteria bacterium]|nr:sodium:alanine symporter family protein [Gammaproteobacteria bacterium]MDP2140230.1 sodium:alanine symporter family protein [Gammaproteobacteria bacterium]MDP2348106.1 sodium:alanine symporter family protein [Gammaproteobacteria bacterium]
MDSINSLLIWLDRVLAGSAWFPYLLLFTGLFFTIYLKFPQVRYFRHAIKVARGRFDKEGAPGDTSHFQALTTALAGTVGTGNIGGVAFALFLGGPAALFWMWMTAFLGMTTKFVEVTLSHKYRVKTTDGSMAGGPMYYMEYALKARWLAMLFAGAAIVTSFGIGNFPQINSIAAGMQSSFAISPLVTGGVLTVALALVVIGGIKRIAQVAEKMVPTMAIIYLLGALAVIIPNIGNVGSSFVAIFSDVFTGSAATGGFLGATIAYAFNRGVNRGLFSNEAGLGSSAIAHAAARTNEPADEGMVALLEPFIDTIIICTVTGLVILSSGVWSQKHENTFSRSDIDIVAGTYSDQNQIEREALFRHLSGGDPSVSRYNGDLVLAAGRLQNSQDLTVLHARSVAEDMLFFRDGALANGAFAIVDGRPSDTALSIEGRSLIHSVPLTSKAFSQGLLGDFGQHIVSIGLLLFAFSTAIAWSYYGDRAVTYLFGPKAVMPYRVVYITGFFLAAQADTTLIWNISAVTLFFMAMPNLIGILLLRKDMRATVDTYWATIRNRD